MSKLDTYREKRDFSVTSEPEARLVDAGGERKAFVVQKHDATRLHYDFRLEWDGVLWSWAVTKGPSADPSEKRLAVRTEDHPVDYGRFEGTIPKGSYGGGTVMLWDRGWWEPLHDPAEGLAQGKLHFRLHGARLEGGWALVRMRGRSGEKRENWLLIKERDDYAGRTPDALLNKFRTSVTTGRSMRAIAAGSSPATPAGHDMPLPRFRKVQLATLRDAPPDGDGWQHEAKFDGYRCLMAVGKGGVRLYTRNGKDWSDRFGSLVDPAAALPCDAALIDGEVIAGGGGGDFSALQKALKAGDPLMFYAFDCLHLDGTDLTDRPLSERRAALEGLLKSQPAKGPVRLSPMIEASGEDALQAMCGANGEGIVSKLRDAPYRGGRGTSWIKSKCTRRAEFVIVGWAPSDKRGRAFSSLLLGSHEAGQLRYRGRVGTGFDGDDLDGLSAAMDARSRKTPPVEGELPPETKGARWVTPNLVAEVAYTEFTGEGRIRHGVYLGLREDKEAGEVTAEAEEALDSGEETAQTEASAEGDAGDEHEAPDKRDARAKGKPRAREGKDSAGTHAKGGKASEETVAGVRISSADRVVIPQAGLTKGDVARHYARVAERFLSHAGDRPVSLLRCPDGIARKCFFQKHAGKGFPDAVRTVEIEEKDGDLADYMYLSTAEGVVGAVQMGTLEFHIWGASRDRLERPDRMVFDLDPDEGLSFDTVRDAAHELREALDRIGLPSVPMVTGGKGIHVIVPLRRTAGWDTVKTFAQMFATVLSKRHPDRYTATMSKAKRKNRVFIDWLRNERGATAVAPYGLRARDAAAVAVPLDWDELDGVAGGDAFSVGDMEPRMSRPCPLTKVRAKGISSSVVSALEDWAGAEI